jgi:hypothetical protein
MSGLADYLSELPPETQSALSGFNQCCEAVSRDFVDQLNAQKQPEIIYHYTDYRGLHGILKSGKLWLNDIYSLNDPTELTHGIESARRIVETKIDRNRPAQLRFYSEYIRWGTNDGLESIMDGFVCSFSSKRDDIAQWRAYGDDGQGYALGFDRLILESQFQSQLSQENSKHSFCVTYNNNELSSIQIIMYTNLEEVLNLLWKISDPIVYKKYSSLLIRLLDLYGVLSGVLFKNESYRGEEEFRLLVLRDPKQAGSTQLRLRPHQLIRYIDFAWSGSLKEIVIGPAAPREQSLKFVRACQRAYLGGNSDVEVAQSPIPYRR